MQEKKYGNVEETDKYIEKYFDQNDQARLRHSSSMYGGLESELAKAQFDDRVVLRQVQKHRRHLADSGMKRYSVERVENLYQTLDAQVNP